MVILSTGEQKILARLRRARGRFVSRPALAEAVYGDPGKLSALSSAIGRLRRKGVAVESKRGSGYRLAESPSVCIPEPIAGETPPRLPPTLAQTLGPILAAGLRDFARRHALSALARRAVSFVAGPRPSPGAIELARRADGVFELPPAH